MNGVLENDDAIFGVSFTPAPTFEDPMALRSFFRSLLGLLLASAAAGLPLPALAQAPDWKKIRIGVEGSYPPFSMIAADGGLGGFDIDIARALCAAMHADCTFVQQQWDGMIPALKVRKFDAIVASMTITDERRKVLDFSDPYYDIPSRWVAPVGGVKDVDPATLKGKRIVVLRNSPRAKYVLERYKDSDVLQATKEPDVYLELAAGRGDVAFGSSVVSAEAFLKRPEGKAFHQVGPLVRLGDGVGIAFRKDDAALRERFDAALRAIKADGRYRQVASRYFDFDVSGDTK